MRLAPLIIFALAYLGLAFGRVPGLSLNRAGFAVLGGAAMLVAGATVPGFEMSLADGVASIHAETLLLLFALMLLSALHEEAGTYALVAKAMTSIRTERALLAACVAASAGLSALLTNDVVCFALTPLVIGVTRAAGMRPVPFLLALACASNIGSALTPIGNPQNIFIAQHLGLEFGSFVVACAAPTIVSLVVLQLWVGRRSLRDPAASPTPTPALEVNRGAVALVTLLTVIVVGLFLSPVDPGLTALGLTIVALAWPRMGGRGGAVRDPLERLGGVDWQLLAMFVGLFILADGVRIAGWTEEVRFGLARSGWALGEVGVMTPVVTVLSNLISNVPAVMVVLPFVDDSPGTGHLLALVSTFAGNLLLIGSVANLIVAQAAEREGVRIGVWEHAKVGVPVTLASLGAVVVAEVVGLLG